MRIQWHNTCCWIRWCAKLATPSSGWKTVQMVFYTTFTSICQGTWGWAMVLSNESWGMFFFKGSLSRAKRYELNFGLFEHFSRMYCGGCGMTWDVHVWWLGKKRVLCYSFFFAMELWRAPGCIRQHCLAMGWLFMFHLETRYPLQLLIFIIPNSSRDPIVLALRKVFVKQIWNCNVVKQYCCTLKDQRPTGLIVGLSELVLTTFPDTPRAFVLPCQWCWSSAISGWDIATLCSFLCISSPDCTHLAGRWQILHHSASLPATAWACINKPH